MNPVAVIAYVAHDKSFLNAVEASGALVYTLTRQGRLKAVSGPDRDSVKDIPAQHVVWVGVPSKWVKKLGVLKFKSHYVGSSPGRWHRERDSHRAIAEIKSAQKAVEAGDKKLQKARADAQTQAIERARLAALHAAPDYYVPQELR